MGMAGNSSTRPGHEAGDEVRHAVRDMANDASPRVMTTLTETAEDAGRAMMRYTAWRRRALIFEHSSQRRQERTRTCCPNPGSHSRGWVGECSDKPRRGMSEAYDRPRLLETGEAWAEVVDQEGKGQMSRSRAPHSTEFEPHISRVRTNAWKSQCYRPQCAAV